MDIKIAHRVMVEAAVKTGRLLLEMQPKALKLASTKDFLTNADVSAENEILAGLESGFQNVPFYSEECGGKPLESGYQWIIDPLDGSVNFFIGDSYWGLSIALVENGKSVAGVVYLPATKEIFRATCSKAGVLQNGEGGAQLNGCKIEVNQSKSLSESQVWIDWVKEKRGGADHEMVRSILEKLDHYTLYPQVRNCCVANMMMVARGRIAGFVHPKPEPFDIAAAGLIVESAGGRVTDMEGNPWSPFSSSIVATNGFIHDELLGVLNGK